MGSKRGVERGRACEVCISIGAVLAAPEMDGGRAGKANAWDLASNGGLWFLEERRPYYQPNWRFLVKPPAKVWISNEKKRAISEQHSTGSWNSGTYMNTLAQFGSVNFLLFGRRGHGAAT